MSLQVCTVMLVERVIPYGCLNFVSCVF